MTAPHAAVVLAAGRSRRLGQPKQLLRRQGETLLHRAVRLAAATLPTHLVVVLPATGDWTASLSDLAHLPLINADATSGMASSLRMAAGHVRAFARVLVMGCDQPAMEEQHLHALLTGAQAAPSGCAATLIAGRPSTPAVVPGHWFGALQDAPHEAATTPRDQGFRQRLRALPLQQLHLLDAPDIALDIDTAAHLHAARARGLLDD